MVGDHVVVSLPEQPLTSYEELAVLVAEQARVIAEQAARIAELERRLGMDSSNSSTPTSKESIGAAAKRKAGRQVSQRVRSKGRRPGGQPGRVGSGLEPARGDEVDDTQTGEPPAECRACGAGLDTAMGAGAAWAQVWDIAPVVVNKVAWVLPRRRCACCRTVSTASVPFARAGSVAYGPNINAAAILLGSEGNVPVERTAMLMAALLGAPVSAGFVARAHQRLAERLDAAAFTDRLKDALAGEDVLCGDETPINIAFTGTGAGGEPVPGAPHVITLRTPDGRLGWLPGP